MMDMFFSKRTIRKKSGNPCAVTGFSKVIKIK
jgi:hypothetical protein